MNELGVPVIKPRPMPVVAVPVVAVPVVVIPVVVERSIVIMTSNRGQGILLVF